MEFNIEDPFGAAAIEITLFLGVFYCFYFIGMAIICGPAQYDKVGEEATCGGNVQSMPDLIIKMPDNIIYRIPDNKSYLSVIYQKACELFTHQQHMHLTPGQCLIITVTFFLFICFCVWALTRGFSFGRGPYDDLIIDNRPGSIWIEAFDTLRDKGFSTAEADVILNVIGTSSLTNAEFIKEVQKCETFWYRDICEPTTIDFLLAHKLWISFFFLGGIVFFFYNKKKTLVFFYDFFVFVKTLFINDCCDLFYKKFAFKNLIIRSFNHFFTSNKSRSRNAAFDKSFGERDQKKKAMESNNKIIFNVIKSIKKKRLISYSMFFKIKRNCFLAKINK